MPKADNSACVAAITNCLTAVTGTPTTCASCDPGYGIDAADTKCYKCDATNPTLYTCTTTANGTGAPANKNCASAATHFKGNDGKCYLKDTKCTYTANDGVAPAGVGFNGDGVCDNQCANGYYLDSTTKKCT